ncbi:hypothetical protein [Paenibacillus koleovorans]|uniref:hypothetical protein n=1 Tax=Paenibacillus koleovorans TaxID=121608 RepID=UPI000FD8A3D4|nr:hypothetical protein [Paenibacillus koleovorans]
MKPVYVLFWFDVEDFINDESEAALLGLLEMLDARSVKGIFKLVGEKARRLEQNGRTDIWNRLARHEVGYHTDWHSIHPVVTEYLEPLRFREGAAEFERREGQGFRDVGRITGQPVVCYGQPGAAWAPQTYPVLRKWGIHSYIDSHNQVTFHDKPFWYGGLLNLTTLTGLMGMPLRDGALGPAKHRFDELCEAQREEPFGIISIFYHPTEFVFEEFWDAVNFSKGNNPLREDWVKPRMRPPGDRQRFIDMVGEFVDYTLSRPNVSYITTGDLVGFERTNSAALSEDEVRRFAARTGDRLGYLTESESGRSLSAGELFSVYRCLLLGEEPLPELLYGPERDLPSDEQASELLLPELIAALREPLPRVEGFPMLPDRFRVGDVWVNPVDLACTMAAAIAAGAGEGERAKAVRTRSEESAAAVGIVEEQVIPLVRGRLTAADHASDTAEWTKYWVIFPEKLQVPNIIEMSKLQAWTLKPAYFR